jgi:hypothetical protein
MFMAIALQSSLLLGQKFMESLIQLVMVAIEILVQIISNVPKIQLM